MWKNYLKIAIRNLRAQKLLSTINILGLSIGLACFSLFLLYAVNEFSFDRFHAQADHIYRVYRQTEALAGRDVQNDPHLPMPLGPAMQANLPDVEAHVRFRDAWGEDFVRVGDQVQRLGVTFADPQVFSVFSFPLKHGDPATALRDPGSLVLTETTAQQLFGAENPLGRTLEIKLGETYEPFTVSAVAEDLPPNSSITFGLLASYERLARTSPGQRFVDSWNRSAFQTFVLLRPGSSLPTDADRLLTFRRTYYPDEEAELREQGYWKGEGAPVTYGLQPLRDVHTNPEIGGGSTPPVNPKNVWMLLAIAAGVLLIACINFTTLAIGRSARRAREVGIRKVVGGRRSQLATQFLTEALLLSVVSVLIGVGLGRLLLPFMNELAGRELVFSFRLFPEIGWLLLGLTLVVGLLAGSYPAFVLSGFRPVEVLKSRVRVGGANVLTKSLVTVQFLLSIGLIAATLIVLDQLHLMRSKHPGFEKENVVVVDADGTDAQQAYPRFRQALAGRSEIVGIAGAELGLGEGTGWSRTGWDYQGVHKETFEYYVDADYLGVMGLQLAAGRDFDPARAADTLTSVIVNEAFVRDLGWTPETAVGQPLTGYFESKTPVVIGVVKDFHFRPFREPVEPQLFHQFSDYQPYKFFVRLQSGQTQQALTALQSAWEQAVPDAPFKYSFLDADLDRFYRAESRFAGIVGWAGGLSIFLACLGLFGLAALASINRTKEVGIRKVLGASLGNIVRLLTRDMLLLVALALVLAAPLSWYFMQLWLDDFAYRISLQWWHFALAGGLVLVVAFATAAYHAVRAATANPVKALRTE